jgi:hypothetical protein
MRRTLSSGRAPRPARHALRTTCQVVRLRDFRLVADRIENLSATGLLVTPAEPVLTGEPVLVSFRFPVSGEWLDATATVARVVHGRRPGEWTRSLGLEFEGLDDAARELIAAHLRVVPPAPPRERPGRRAFSRARVAALSATSWAFKPRLPVSGSSLRGAQG